MIQVVNPNCLVDVTRAIEATARRAFGAAADAMAFHTLADGPAGIVTQADADAAGVLVERHVRSASGEAAAVVLVACFSDPGVRAARAAGRVPVIGIGHAGLTAAIGLGERVGVIAISTQAIPRHLRAYAAAGLDRHVAGERAIDLPVQDSGDEERALERLVAVGRALRDGDGADVVLLGCAGMGALRSRVEAELGVPVIDPCVAGMSLALMRARDLAGIESGATT